MVRSIRRKRGSDPRAGHGKGIRRGRNSVGHVVVDGAIAGDKIFNRFPDAASREESLINIEAIVNTFAFLYGQPFRGWSFEVDVRTRGKNGEATAPIWS